MTASLPFVYGFIVLGFISTISYTSYDQYDSSLQGSEKDKKKELAEKEERAKKVSFYVLVLDHLPRIFLRVLVSVELTVHALCLSYLR